MSDTPGDPDLAPIVRDLVTTLRDLEGEFEPRTESGLPRPPSPREMVRLTSEVGIPAAVLVLRANIEALQLLQKALRLADGRGPTAGSSSGDVRRRAEQVSSATLSRLDGALADLQDAVEGRPENEEARELLDEARDLREDVERRLSERADGERANGEDSEEALDSAEEIERVDEEQTDVPVDVDAELQSIKDEFDDDGDDEDD